MFKLFTILPQGVKKMFSGDTLCRQNASYRKCKYSRDGLMLKHLGFY